MMKKTIFVITLLLICLNSFLAQSVGINTTSPDASAILDINSTTKGLLMPRLNTGQMNAIASPAIGLVVYNTDSSSICIRTSASWVKLQTQRSALNYVGNSYLGINSGYGSVGSSEGTSSHRINIALGDSAMHSNLNGYDNVAIGSSSLKSNTSGFSNIAIGKNSLETNISGQNNLAIGTYSLNKNTTGNYNVVLGNNGLLKNTLGNFNIAIGQNTLQENTTGAANTAVGDQALSSNTTANSNTAIGTRALRVNSTGAENTAIGLQALLANTNGSYNVALGNKTSSTNTTGNNNTAIGFRAGSFNNGSNNVFLGYFAGYDELGSNKLYIENSASMTPLIYGEFDNNKVVINDSLESKTIKITSGAANDYFLKSDSEGHGSWVNINTYTPNYWTIIDDKISNTNTSNVGIGVSNPSEKLQVAGNIDIKNGRLSISDNYASIAIGGSAGLVNTGTYNIFLGNEAGLSNTSGVYNTFLGNFTGKKNTTANYNTFVGFGTAENNTTGENNSALGFYALNKNTAGRDNVAMGFGAAENNTTGNSNSAFGFYALNKNTTGKDNVAMGYGALEKSTTASFNTANGSYALYKNTTGFGNVALGHKSLENNTTSFYNTAVGFQSLNINLDGEENTALGTFAMQDNIDGSYNTAIGLNSLKQNTIGDDNVVIGYEAGYGNKNGAENTYVGYQAGYLSASGSDNVFIGYKVGYNETGSNKLYIDNSNTASPLIWGDFQNNFLNFNANVGIGTVTPTQAKLVVNGANNDTLSYAYLNSAGNVGSCMNCAGTYSIYASSRVAASEFNAFSDRRIKKNFHQSNNHSDLKSLMAIQVTDYQLIDSIAKGNKVYKKVIAQDLAKVYPTAVSMIKDVLPDIYKLADMKNGFVNLPNTTIKVGEKVKLIIGENQELVNVSSISQEGFQTDLKNSGTVFVYGREVDDFHTVDYEALSTLNISATQELVKQLNQIKSQNEILRANNDSMRADIEALKGAVFKKAN
jgi:trimeric autotransporter adhesin